MEPATMMAIAQMAQQVLNPPKQPAPQASAQVPTSSFQGGGSAGSPFNMQRGPQMVNGLGPLLPPVMSAQELDAIEESVEAPKQQVTDAAETPSFGKKLGNAATSPEALSAMMQLALAPRSNPAPMVSPMNTTSSFQGGAGMNPYQMLAQRRR